MNDARRVMLVGAAVMALLAACGPPDEPLGPQIDAPPGQVPPEEDCLTAFAEVEVQVESLSAAGDMLDGTIARCDSFEEWRATLEGSEIALDQDPAALVEARCAEVDELAGSPVCVQAAE